MALGMLSASLRNSLLAVFRTARIKVSSLVRGQGMRSSSNEREILRLLRIMMEEGVKVAESPEVTKFREEVAASLDNISNDIKTLLARNPGLSDEDKAALTDIAANIKSVADIVPE